jgi:S-formylglutathione hydrolase FrmB
MSRSDPESGWSAPVFHTVEISDPRYEREDLRQVTVKSPALAQRADLTIHATPAARATTDVPVVVLLHGVYGSHWAWTLRGGAHVTSARLQLAGELPPCVLVMPSDGLWGDGSGYLPHRLQDFERWIVNEVPAAAAHAVSAISPNSPVFIAGLSMGGFGALRLGAKFPQRFRAISAHSSITHFDQFRDFVEERLGSFTVQDEDRDVFQTLYRNRELLPPIRFDCGTSDSLLDSNRLLHQALLETGIHHVYEEFPGGHEWSYWEKHLENTLHFFAREMKSTSASSTTSLKT